MKKDIKIIISPNDSIKKVMNVIEETGCRCALVTDDNRHLIGIVTDGDIRKHILKGIDLNLSVRVIMNTHPIVLREEYSPRQAKEIMIKNGITLIPIVSADNVVIDYLHLPQLISELERNGGLERNNKKAYEIKRVLVIGGAGYIGSVLVRRLMSSGYTARVMDILLYGDDSIKGLYGDKDFEFVRRDCRNMQDVICALDGVDAVVHLGEIVGDMACSLSPDFTIEVNYMATKTLAEACCYCGINRFIFSSSCSVYGINGGISDEKSALNPISLYAKCKVESERAILSIKDDYFTPAILRLATVYGLSYRPRFDLVINLLTAKAVCENKINIFGGEQWRPFVSINDVADAILCMLQTEGRLIKREIFNIGSNEQNYQIHQLGNLIKQAVPDIEIETKKEAVDNRNYRVCFDKVNRLMGFECKRSVIDEVLAMKDYILNTKGIDVNDPRFSNHRSLIGAQAV